MLFVLLLVICFLYLNLTIVIIYCIYIRKPDLMIVLFALISARCPESSVHGHWIIQYEDMTVSMPSCGSVPKATINSLNITLRTTGLAVTDDGFQGTWALSGS